MNSNDFIPENDMDEFCSLPDELQCEMRLWIEVLNSIIRSENKAREIRAQAYRLSGQRGFSRCNIIRKYYAIKQGGNWRRLVNHAKVKRRDAVEKKYERGILIH